MYLICGNKLDLKYNFSSLIQKVEVYLKSTPSIFDVYLKYTPL